MQSSIDADYISHLGADPKKIYVTGNTKFDQTYAEVTPEDLENYKKELGIENAYPIRPNSPIVSISKTGYLDRAPLISRSFDLNPLSQT